MQKGPNRNSINEQKQLTEDFYGRENISITLQRNQQVYLSIWEVLLTKAPSPMKYYEEHKACKIQSLLSLSSTPPTRI